MRIIADTGFVVAIADRKDPKHRICIELYRQYDIILVPQTVLNESCYLLREAGGNRLLVAFLRQIPTSNYIVLPLEPEDIERTADILEKYADSRVDFVDASVAAVAERLNITRILTLDQRDFSIIRPRHTSYFEILPR